MPYTIAVSGINAIDNPGPGTGIARSLKESGLDVRIIGLAYDAMEPGIFMDWVIDKSYILPYPSGDSNSYIERLQYIHEKEHIDVLIPALDVELPLFMKRVSDIRKEGIGLLIPTPDSYRLRSKEKLPECAPKIGVKTPEIIPMSSVSDLARAGKKLGYPMMIKGPFYEAAKASNRDEAEKEFHQLAAKWGYPVIAQRFITGDEYNCIGLGDGEGNDLGHCAVKKMLITKLGKIWTNVTINNQEIFTITRNFVSSLKWCGGFEIELIFEHATNSYYLLEINPRFPAWIYAATGCGINLAERMVQHILHLPHETHSQYKAGKILIRYTGELIRDISDFEKLTTIAEL